MPSDPTLHEAIVRRRVRRRFPLRGLRPRSPNPQAPGQIPANLSNPLGAITEPGRTIWKFDGAPINLGFDDGAIVTTARLVPLFWGEFWRTATNPSIGDVHQAIARILASPYLSEVTQYGFQSLTLDPAVIVISPGPPAPTFSADKVKDMVWDLIDDDRFPEPDEPGGRIIYMVFGPQGAIYEDGEAAGAHGEASDIDFFDVDYAWVAWCNYGTLDDLTEIFTHELVETLTDPEPAGGWTARGFPDTHNEIVDVCLHQMGMVDGYRVSAYYSDRLKACVVPSFPPRFGLSVTARSERMGPALLTGLGVAGTTKASTCFEGQYGWKLLGQQRRWTLTATAVGYVEPSYEWFVAGQSAFPNPAISVPTIANLDPLSMITTVPPGTVTARVTSTDNVLTLESQLGDLAGDFEVQCIVTEARLPNGYHSARKNLQIVTINGGHRVMDARFDEDLVKCLHLKAALARVLIEEVVIPRIDRGDPPPVWLEQVLVAPESDAEQQARRMRFLAHVVEGAEPALAANLRALAHGVLATFLAREALEASAL